VNRPASLPPANRPPIKSDAEFREIRAADGSRGLEEIKEERLRRILAEFARFRPLTTPV